MSDNRKDRHLASEPRRLRLSPTILRRPGRAQSRVHAPPICLGPRRPAGLGAAASRGDRRRSRPVRRRRRQRSGFARLTAEVALGHVGIMLGLEVSRLARNNADWYRLLDLCGLTDTLIGDADGVYHPALFNDRLLLGLKGTMSEAELHVLRARLNGGIRNKAARGELRRGLPVGFVWGEEDGEVRFHPDEAVCTAMRTVFARFAELGSVRRVWLWFRSEGLSFPLQTRYGGSMRWVDPSYIAIYHVLTNPVYAGAYAYGKSRHEVTLDGCGTRKKRVRKLPQSQWSVLIPDHHKATSIGAPMRPIARASAPIRIRAHINQAEAP